jgi:hypothetical protein
MGEFTIEDGEFTSGPPDLEALFKIYSQDTPSVWEGPVDFALADRMCRDLPGGYKILQEDHGDDVGEYVY